VDSWVSRVTNTQPGLRVSQPSLKYHMLYDHLVYQTVQLRTSMHARGMLAHGLRC
jgi:hypothetical protein